MKLDGKTITWDLKPFELYFPDWIDAIDQRKSVRIFDQQPIPQDVASSLEDMAARLSQVVPGFRIYVDAKPADGVFVMQSGRFRGTSGFAAFMTKYGWEEVS